MAREWMTVRDPEKLQRSIEYVLALLYVDHGPMPEPDVELAEMGMSMLAGMLQAATGRVVPSLEGIDNWMEQHPGLWPTIPMDN